MSDTAPQPGETPPASTPRPTPMLSGWRGAVAIGFATALIVFGLLVMTGPFWAPAITPLFGTAPAPASADATLDRLTQLETAQREDRQKIEQALAATQKPASDMATSMQQLERRIAAVESKSTTSPNDTAELRQRLAALESKPASSGELDKVREQVRTLEAKSAAAPVDLIDIRQQLQQLAATSADLAKHVAALEKGEQTQSASDPTDTGLLLAVLQIRDAIDTGRPFPAEYDALAGLAKSRPDVSVAAAPLAEPAKSGVATRIVLIERLRALSGAIVTAQPNPAEEDWAARASAQLRSLVTIRRVDGSGQSASEAAVGAAERSLAAGDLAAAISAIEGLTGPAAEARRPWLQMARQRGEAEEALHRVQAIVVARPGPAR